MIPEFSKFPLILLACLGVGLFSLFVQLALDTWNATDEDIALQQGLLMSLHDATQNNIPWELGAYGSGTPLTGPMFNFSICHFKEI